MGLRRSSPLSQRYEVWPCSEWLLRIAGELKGLETFTQYAATILCLPGDKLLRTQWWAEDPLSWPQDTTFQYQNGTLQLNSKLVDAWLPWDSSHGCTITKKYHRSISQYSLVFLSSNLCSNTKWTLHQSLCRTSTRHDTSNRACAEISSVHLCLLFRQRGLNYGWQVKSLSMRVAR